jgi:hypothetical protein
MEFSYQLFFNTNSEDEDVPPEQDSGGCVIA